MSPVDSINLTGAATVELVRRRNDRGDGRLTIHLPMDLGLFASLLSALGDLGFEFLETTPKQGGTK